MGRSFVSPGHLSVGARHSRGPTGGCLGGFQVFTVSVQLPRIAFLTTSFQTHRNAVSFLLPSFLGPAAAAEVWVSGPRPAWGSPGRLCSGLGAPRGWTGRVPRG